MNFQIQSIITIRKIADLLLLLFAAQNTQLSMISQFQSFITIRKIGIIFITNIRRPKYPIIYDYQSLSL